MSDRRKAPRAKRPSGLIDLTDGAAPVDVPDFVFDLIEQRKQDVRAVWFVITELFPLPVEQLTLCAGHPNPDPVCCAYCVVVFF